MVDYVTLGWGYAGEHKKVTHSRTQDRGTEYEEKTERGQSGDISTEEDQDSLYNREQTGELYQR
jgi:hypothetical protein